jgi:hypothetical protein
VPEAGLTESESERLRYTIIVAGISFREHYYTMKENYYRHEFVLPVRDFWTLFES